MCTQKQRGVVTLLDNIIDILPIFLLILFVFKIKFIKPLSSTNTNYLSVLNGCSYRGLFALVVIFHHLAQQTESGMFFHQFTKVGYLAVAVFFFLSGYGLQLSHMNSETYQKRFLLRRLPTILIPYIIVTLLYWIINGIQGKFYTLKEIFVAIINGYPIVDSSWYVITILIFYVIYWLLMVLCKKHYLLMILGGCIWYIVYSIFCIKMQYGDWWYNSAHLLIVGMFWATYEKRIIQIIQNHYFMVTMIIWVVFAVLFCKHDIIISLLTIKRAELILSIITAVFFTLSFILFSLKFQIGNKVLDFLGKISFEMYLIHGIFIRLSRNSIIYIENELLWCIIVLISTISFSFLLHILFSKLLSKYKSFIKG